MEIILVLDAEEPPQGRAVVLSKDAVSPFAGWLGLLRSISQLLDSTEEVGDAELRPASDP